MTVSDSMCAYLCVYVCQGDSERQCVCVRVCVCVCMSEREREREREREITAGDNMTKLLRVFIFK